MSTNVFIEADIPTNLLRNFLQHIRDFDTNNPSCHFSIIGITPNLTTEQAAEAMNVVPGLDVVVISSKDQGKD